MINDESWGLYPNIQQLDKKHASEWFLDEECTRWRAEDPNGSAPGCGEPGGPGGGPGGDGPNFGAGTSSLNYLGLDTIDYLDHYTLKKAYKENPWNDLVIACQAIDESDTFFNPYLALNETLDVDATLWHLANEIIFSDDDSYIHKGGMDYYVYYDSYNERILPIEYDGNSVFKNQNDDWSPFYHEDDTDFALLNKLLNIPELRERYLAHFRTILNNSFDSDYINDLIDTYSDFIDQYVYDDPQKIYTYNQFLNEVNALKNFFSNRASYLWSNSEVSENGIEILNIEYSVGNNSFAQPTSSDEVLISVTVDETQDFPDEVNLYYGTGLVGLFAQVPMVYGFSSGVYTYTISPQNTGEYVRFYVETVNANGSRVYEPEGAEHDVYIYQVKMENIILGDLVINEIMASNDSVVMDEFDEFDDWVEIYNNGSETVDLEGFHLSDDISNLGKYTFSSITISPNNYLIIWADDDEEDQGDNHATFKLSASGEELYLSDSDFNILDGFTFGEQEVDMGYARVPNGTGDFIIQSPTFSSNNNQVTSQIESHKTERSLVKIVDVLGREVNDIFNTPLFYIYDNGQIEKKVIIL